MADLPPNDVWQANFNSMLMVLTRTVEHNTAMMEEIRAARLETAAIRGNVDAFTSRLERMETSLAHLASGGAASSSSQDHGGLNAAPSATQLLIQNGIAGGAALPSSDEPRIDPASHREHASESLPPAEESSKPNPDTSTKTPDDLPQQRVPTVCIILFKCSLGLDTDITVDRKG